MYVAVPETIGGYHILQSLYLSQGHVTSPS